MHYGFARPGSILASRSKSRFRRGSVSKIRALVIDEHIEVRRALTSRLTKCEDLVVLPAGESLDQGLTLVSEHHPDVVLLGLPVLQDARDLTGIADLAGCLAIDGAALLVLTTYSDEEDRKAILRAGARRYMLKDVDTDGLIKEIERALTETAAYAKRPRAGRKPQAGRLPNVG